MKFLNTTVVAAVLVAVATSISPASADIAQGSIGTGKKIQSRNADHSKPKSVKMRQAPRRGAETARDVRPSEGDGTAAYTTIRRSRNGEITRTPPSDALKRSLLEDQRADLPADAGSAGQEQERVVVGNDDRIQLQDSFSYPFSATGIIVIRFEGDDGIYGCSAALVGPSTVVTTAYCVYDHEMREPWAQSVTFWPGSNGEDVDLGGFEASNFAVMDGFVSKWDGSYGSVWQYDVAMLNLDEPIGEELGWYATEVVSRQKGFDGNLVGYHSDLPTWTMWRSKCRVEKSNILKVDIIHTCDSAGDVAAGAPLYVFHGADKARQLVGVHEGAESDRSNWAMRIDKTIATWISDLSE
jgi:V8-like Glu-specific endopeptidase